MSVSLNLSSRLEAFSIKIAASLSWVSCSVRLSPEKALETISKRLLDQIKDGETPSKELGELAKVMKQAVEIRQELQEERGGQETGVRVVFEREAEEFSG